MRHGVIGGITGAFIAVGISLLAQSWTTPRTWVTGEVVSAGQLNTHVRDNLSYLYNALATLDASDTISGVFDVARMPDLDAEKITSGQFGTARIPDLDAGKITSGQFGTARMPNVIVDLATDWEGTEQSTGLTATWIDTGLSATITVDNATNDLHILVWQSIEFSTGSIACQLRLVEGTANVLWTSAAATSSENYEIRRAYQRINPGSGSRTYKTQFIRAGGVATNTCYVNPTGNGLSRGEAIMQIFEIAN